jgi:hypothetical protein
MDISWSSVICFSLKGWWIKAQGNALGRCAAKGQKP